MRREYTAQDIEQFNKAGEQLRANGFDEFTQEGIQHNADLLDAYFQQNPSVPVTIANIYNAIEAQKTSYKWLSPAQTESERVTADNPAAATKLSEWFAGQGKPGMLVNTGDEGHENFAILLAELRGRDVNPTTIQQAIGRIAFNGRRQLHVVPVPHKVDPRSHVATDDGTPFLGNDLRKQADGSYGKSPADYARERAAAAAKNNPTATDSAKLLEAQARQDAESIRGNSRYQDSILSRIIVFKPGTTDTDWVQTLQSRRAILRTWVAEASGNRSVR
jgi:hypothetical protein